ncbi:MULTISPECIES: class I SAM-dependent methyltransferase [Agrobacterium]|uniref:class I SAM-dependent methyltransferase n=1 Tax=Agrobacterium TaxID=357 RepID=UPI0015718CDE|nr:MULTISPECIES: class I SAM-dependent methyltransferase [Agrobacterium]MBO9110265.1 class I SAM-dependent methyltransferase [Agrobacterium sp. S2/73]NTA17387.1 class I SAM-dependent methyltransferase [Agrobacterium tumefaciens]QXZ74200.1 class I SAM-dependent methyltransferase [Agrobacterium sp. S7/73]WCK72705.1 class I SAM-dependent methyltransferase [Agrobacterium tumefaciens]
MRQVKKRNLDGASLITPDTVAKEIFARKTEAFDEHFAVAKAEIAIILELAQQQFENGVSAHEIIHRTAGALHGLREKLHSSVWAELIPLVQNHSVSDYFLEDPFTRWSFEKPRGYSGDAQLLDFIYGHDSVADKVKNATPLGAALYNYTKDASSSVAVRERRDLLTRFVDEAAARHGSETEILTIASGHLREADASVALKEGKIRRWVALDQDPLSVGSVARDFNDSCIEAIDGSVRDIVLRSHELGKFDLVYAAGLYDYLNDKVAIKLTRRCMEMLKPGGMFLFANFSEDIVVDGYMETFMNWALLLRSKADMWRIVNASADPASIEAEVFFGENHNIVYATMRKKA